MSDTKHLRQKDLRAATQLVHGGTTRSQFGELSEALYLTQGFAYDSMEQAEARFKGEQPGHIYARYSNPTVAMFEERMALLEGAEAGRATASGMAAVTAAVMGQVKAGDHVVAARALFGSCLYVIEDLLPRFGVATTLVDGGDLDQWRAAMRPETKVLFLETPTNPTLEVYDIAAIAEIAHAGGATLVIDNVFSTPLQQRPLALGADVVVYSATKHVDGHGRCLGGIVLATNEFVETHLRNYLRHTGPAMSPFNAWVLLKSLESMSVRVAYQTASAARIADALAEMPGIRRVIYPGRADHPQAEIVKRQMTGGSTLVAFEIDGAKDGAKPEAFRFANALGIFSISNNLGDAKSIMTHPATTTHQRLTPEAQAHLGITDGLIRLSIGLEDPDDLIDDLRQALGNRAAIGMAAE